LKEYQVYGNVPGVGCVAVRIFAYDQSSAASAFMAQCPHGRVTGVERIQPSR